MSENAYAYWYEELDKPGCNPRDTDRRDLAGFYRMKGAETKPDFPVAIWPRQGDGKLLLKVGRTREIEEGTDKFWDFLMGGWLASSAVPHESYQHALDQGVWADNGKAARQVEKVPEKRKEPEQAPAPVEVHNRPAQPPVRQPGVQVAAGDNGGPALGQEIAEKVKAENALLRQLTAQPVTDKDTAEKVGECVNRLLKLKGTAETDHKAAKAYWLEGGRKVDAAFNPSIKAADEGMKFGRLKVKAFLDAEQKRLEAKAAEEAAIKQAEMDRRAKEEAELTGKPLEEIEVKQVQPKHVVAKVGGAAGKSITVNQRRYYRAEITDYYALVDAFKDEPELYDAVVRIAHRLANVKDATIPKGMRVVEVQEAA